MLTMEQIRHRVAPIVSKYRLESLDLFGSYADGGATEKSDIDFLAKFEKEVPSIFDVAGLQCELQNALSVPVDVVTLPIANPKRMKIGQAVRIYGK